MEPIHITSKMDFDTYYKIGLRNYFGVRTLIQSTLLLLILQVFVFDSTFSWQSEFIAIGIVVLVHTIVIPGVVYLFCKRNMKLPFMQETHRYTITNEKIEHQSESITASSSWQYIKEVFEAEGYLVLISKMRGIHYLPKNGFDSQEHVGLLKDIIRHNNIKAYFKQL